MTLLIKRWCCQPHIHLKLQLVPEMSLWGITLAYPPVQQAAGYLIVWALTICSTFEFDGFAHVLALPLLFL